jgi:hypothetical protein
MPKLKEGTMTTQGRKQRWQSQETHLFHVERKETGAVVHGEKTYYYEKSLQLPGREKQILLEDREAHSASHPFCVDLFCACHWHNVQTIRLLVQLVSTCVLTNSEAKSIFTGRRPLLVTEIAIYQQQQRWNA